MDVNLIIAMIQRREQRARDNARAFEKDPKLAGPARDERSKQDAMAALRIDIQNALAIEERDR